MPQWVQAEDKVPVDPVLKEALSLQIEGDDHYDKGEYELAIAAYEKAYELSKGPGFLFNIGQAYRLLGSCDKALEFYRMFLASQPDVARRTVTETRVSQMEACLAKEEAGIAQGQADEARREAEAEKQAQRALADMRAHRRKRLIGIGSAGAGLVMLGIGTYFAIDSRSAADDVSAHLRDGGAWTKEFRDLHEQGQRSEKVAIGLFVGGGAAVVTGAVFYYLGWQSKEQASPVTATVTGDGLVLGWEAAF